jgi:hypothetical protein
LPAADPILGFTLALFILALALLCGLLSVLFVFVPLLLGVSQIPTDVALTCHVSS